MTRHRLAFGLMLVCTSAWGETAYVTDELRLGLHQLQDTSDRPFEVLVSGTALEILERVPNYARVRTPGGQTGWVKSGYLVDQPPARFRLAEIEQRETRLAGQLEQARSVAETASGRVGELERQLAEASSKLASFDGMAIRNDELQSELAAYGTSVRWPLALGGIVLALLGGFLAGRAWIERQIRQKFGGLKVF